MNLNASTQKKVMPKNHISNLPDSRMIVLNLPFDLFFLVRCFLIFCKIKKCFLKIRKHFFYSVTVRCCLLRVASYVLPVASCQLRVTCMMLPLCVTCYQLRILSGHATHNPQLVTRNSQNYYSAITSNGTLTFTSLCRFRFATYSPTNFGSVSKVMRLRSTSNPTFFKASAI